MLDTKMSTVVLCFTQQCNNAYIDCCIRYCNNVRVIALLQSIVDIFRIVRYGKKLISVVEKMIICCRDVMEVTFLFIFMSFPLDYLLIIR